MIAETRQELADLLESATGYKALTFAKRPFSSRTVMVLFPEGRFIDMPEGATMRAPYEIAFRAVFILKNLHAEATTAEADGIFEKAVMAALDADWSVESVNTRDFDTEQGDSFYVAELTLTKFINL